MVYFKDIFTITNPKIFEKYSDLNNNNKKELTIFIKNKMP